MDYAVTEREVAAQPTAVIAAATTWSEFPALWPELLGELWDAVRPRRSELEPGRNVMLYLDDVPHVEIGAEVAAAFDQIGRVVPSSLPAGRVATATHRGPFDQAGAAHEAVIAWCDSRGLERTGVRWEVYGHWDEAAPDPRVDVFWQLR